LRAARLYCVKFGPDLFLQRDDPLGVSRCPLGREFQGFDTAQVYAGGAPIEPLGNPTKGVIDPIGPDAIVLLFGKESSLFHGFISPFELSSPSSLTQ
jgi:hypothetical protein